MTKLIKFFSSLKLTIVLLFLSMILVFIATLDQVDTGIFVTKQRYFEGLFVWVPTSHGVQLPVFPSGFLIGFLLLVNLIVAHFTRFKWSWKKSGIWLTHVGLIILLIGAGLTSYLSIESQLSFREGESALYSESLQKVELVVMTPGEDAISVLSFPQRFLKSGKRLSHSTLPFDIIINDAFSNSVLSASGQGLKKADQGIGLRLGVRSIPPFETDDKRNIVSAYVSLRHQGQDLGTWLLTNGVPAAEPVEIEGKIYYLQIRPMRFYNTYSMTLNDFTHDRYPGTNIPKNFMSDVTITDLNTGAKNAALIYMNSPLRFQGKTYFQASFGEQDKLSILHVVENPSWLFPYISSIIISLGLIIQFCIHLAHYFKKRRAS